MIIDYVWTDGQQEYEFRGDDAFERAVVVWETAKKLGKIWRREFRDGFLEGVSDVTPRPQRIK